ncbi:hypothetical protein DFH27DRAFT_593710 [Peziza echinospora]|nr:hypothetical protein DFH27DRAFT_593710 [Peziza echinospora]
MSGIPRGGGLPRRGDGGADRDRENTNAAGGTRRPASSGTSGTGRTAGGGATGGGAASGTSGTGTSSARGTAASGGGAGGRTGQTGPVMHSSRGGMQAAQARAETPALQRGPQAGATSSANLTSPLAGTPPLKRKDREFDGKNMDDAETNITVVVRCRGRNPKEILANSGVSLHTPGGLKGNQVVLETGAGAMSNKTYTFDRVFPPEADQAMIYDDAIHPIVQEMLAGYNCTIFAYGQTGTGKTYTMAGDMKENDGLVSERAGIIPRTLHNLFSQLEADGSEYTVKCSYLELYNEELRDLQGPINERKEVKIFDDKRGHGVIIQGMEERFIKTAEEGGEILLAGGKRRETQATNCNDLSSRSHTVFTIVVHARVQTAEGEDILRTGKLNLVDLAGSENIGRSGAENKRAREAGMINQSLLTLGRVINHLVDKSQHIPYRESKLTRLLQDSLGGRTKTCIIATISPNKDSLEETMSTLDYAARAKNIRNKPQVNQLVAKKALIKEYVLEIERLKGDLVAARQKNGVYMTDESFRDFTEQSESRRIQVEEQERKIELLTIRATKAAEELREKLLLLNASKKELQDVKDTLEGAMMQLKETTEELQNTKISLREETLLRRAHEKTEGQLDAVGTTMIKSLDQAVSDIDTLLDKVRRGEENEAINKHTWLESSKQVGNVLTRVGDNIDVVAKDHDELTRIVNVTLNKHLNSERTKLTSTYDLIESGLKIFSEKGEELLTDTEISKEQMIQVLEGIKELREEVKARVGEGLQGLGVATERIANEVVSEMAQFQEALHASFSGRGRDFKLAFDSTKKHLNAQKEEIDSLRARLAEAHAQSLAASATATQSLDAILKEERENAARDRAELVEQLTAVLNANANKQNDRLTARIATVQNAIETSGKQLSGVSDEFKEGMENWEKTEDTFMEVLINNREDLKTKLVQDWEQADDYSRRIQVTTRSVHAESVKLVDEQIREVDVQMRSLDQYVTKAKAEYEGHHERFTNTFGNLVSTVDRKFGDTLSTIHGVRNDIQKFGSDMDQSVGSLQKFIPTIVANAQEPLNELRLYMSNAEFKTTAETGNTPHKRKYEYPDKLPRTQPHEVLLEKTLRQQQAARQQQKLLAAQQSQSPMPSIATALFTAGGGALPPPPQPTLAAIKSLKELNPNVDVGHYHRATSVDPPTDTGSLLDMQPPLKKQDLGERGAGASGIGGGAGGGAGGAGGSGAAVAEKKTRSGRGYRGGMENSSMIGGMPGSAGKGRRNARNP